ncbi:hypothetical protein I4F81_011804 [Pyropia yezoensis]|uniref:Uncharacterized protein n=1 Tax=Pyropia yezoensis TaxID=2788 RepID=A0ACC3CGE1_PYRYE|nr:hypothetical protein I4F81_011804 [Neopyropia yezoensis]
MVLMYSLFIALGHVTLVGDAGLGSLAAAPAILTRVWRWLSSVLPIPQMADIIEICSTARLLCFFLGTSWAAIAATSNALELLVDVVAADSTSRDGEVRDQAVLLGRARRTALIYDNVKESSERQVLLMPISVPLGGDWKTEWGYLRTVAADIEAAGLLLAEVVCVADVARGMIPRLPAEEYRHLPWAISEEHLARPLAKHGGRVLRVILCAHPPVMRVFGPRSLGLA